MAAGQTDVRRRRMEQEARGNNQDGERTRMEQGVCCFSFFSNPTEDWSGEHQRKMQAKAMDIDRYGPSSLAQSACKVCYIYSCHSPEAPHSGRSATGAFIIEATEHSGYKFPDSALDIGVQASTMYWCHVIPAVPAICATGAKKLRKN